MANSTYLWRTLFHEVYYIEALSLNLMINLMFMLQKNTVTETLDISDNYVQGEGAKYLAGMLKYNTFIVNLVSTWQAC